MHEIDDDHDFLFNIGNWGSWKFSDEGEKLLKEFLQNGIDKCQTKEPSDKWKFLLSQLPSTSSELEDDPEDDFLVDTRPSEDDSDSGWDEIKLFTSKINQRKQSHENHVDIDKTVDMISALVVSVEEEQPDSAMEIDGNDIDINLSKSQNMFVRNNEKNIIQTSDVPEEDIEDTLGYRKDSHEFGRSERADIPQLLLAKLNADIIDEDGVKEMVETHTLTKEQLTNVWTQLETSDAKIVLSRSLANVALYNLFLCQALLLPWLSSSDFENEKEIVDSIAEILPPIGEESVNELLLPLISNPNGIFVKHLNLLADIMCKADARQWGTLLSIAEILPPIGEESVNELLLPLISNPNGIFVKHLNLLADIMCKADARQWGTLLRRFLNATNVSLEKWQLPIVIKLLEPLTEDSIDAGSTNRLINLLNSSVDEFINDKDFGNLLIAVAMLIHKSKKLSESIKTLKEAAEGYKGIMRFKVMNIIKSSPFL